MKTKEYKYIADNLALGERALKKVQNKLGVPENESLERIAMCSSIMVVICNLLKTEIGGILRSERALERKTAKSSRSHRGTR